MLKNARVIPAYTLNTTLNKLRMPASRSATSEPVAEYFTNCHIGGMCFPTIPPIQSAKFAKKKKPPIRSKALRPVNSQKPGWMFSRIGITKSPKRAPIKDTM